MKEKLLYLSPQNPYPPIDGGKIGIYFPLIYLTKYYDVYAVFPVSNELKEDMPENVLNHFGNLGIKIFFYKKNTKGIKVDILYLLINIFRHSPFKWDKYYSREAQKMIDEIISQNNIRKILVSSPHMARYAIKAQKKLKDVIIILREHNLEFKILEHYKKFESFFLFRLIVAWQLNKTKRLEKKYWQIFDRVLFISDFDLNIAKNIVSKPDEKFHVIYDGFDLNAVENNFFNHKINGFLFPGNLLTEQNKINFKWFLENIWMPLLKINKYPGLKLYISGNNEIIVRDFFHKYFKITNFEEFKIINISFVEDFNKEILKYKYILSPTIIGSGIRLKLLNGMAAGKVVFITPLDMETTKEFRDLDNVVCFNSPNEFLEKLVLLENNKEIYVQICKNAYKTIKSKFSWHLYAKKVYKVFKDIK